MTLAGEDCKDCSLIKVVVTGFRNAKGDAILALFDKREGYPLDMSKAIQKLKAPIEGGKSVFDLKPVAPGSYAVIVLHDESQNGKMDRNLVGMPKEGYGASNDPKMPLFGPPTFESALFKATSGAVSLTIPLHYYPH